MTQFLRRKVDSTCIVPDDLDLVYKKIPCECSFDDWECDTGFTRTLNSCIPLNNGHFEQEAPSDCSEYYTVSSGYVLSKTSHCKGGLDFHNTVRNCPSKDFKMYGPIN